MATLDLQPISSSDPIQYDAATAGGDQFPFAEHIFLHVKNGSADTLVINVLAQKSCNQGFLHNLSIDVGAGTDRLFGPFAEFQADDQNFVQIEYSATTDITIAAVQT